MARFSSILLYFSVNAGQIIVHFTIGFSSVPTDLPTLATDTTAALQGGLAAFDIHAHDLMVMPGSIQGNTIGA